jgi:hypothetical protein
MRIKIGLSRFLLLLFGLLPTFTAVAQIQGRVIDSSKHPLIGASITIKKAGKMISFDVTKADGSFLLKVETTSDTLLLTANKLGYTPQEIHYRYTAKPIEITLEKGDITLKELVVEAPPIRKRGDTLSFKVEEFQSAADRSIGDVLKKIPGIDVEPNGEITYQGKPINRYYVENMNLLDGRYGLVNDNLPHGKVAVVQVFENHQPIRALDSLQVSERAAINIKLKNKVVKTGNFQYGLGYKPFLWNVNATPIVFVPNFQFLASLKSNSTGENLFSQFYDFFQADLLTKENWLQVTTLPTPAFSSTRWMDNRSHALSLNTLKKSKKDLELKINTSLILDRQDREGTFSNTYFLNDETIQYQELKSSRFRTNHFSGSLDIVKNTKKSYFTNKFSWEIEGRADQGTEQRPDRLYKQKNRTDNLSVSHHFERIFSKGMHSIRLHSQSAYTKDTQQLSVKLSGADTTAHPVQDFTFQGFSTHSFADWSVKLAGAVRVSLRTGLQLGLSNIKSDLRGHEIQGPTQNDFNWNTFKPYVSAGTVLYPGKWQINLNLPLSFYTLQYTNTVHRWLPEPNVHANLKISPALHWRSTLRYTNSLGRLGDFHPAYLMRSYLTVQQRDNELPSTQRYTAGTGLLFSDAVSGLNITLNWNYSHLIYNLLPQTVYGADGSAVMHYLRKRNEGQNSMFTALASQYLFPLKTTLRVGLTAFTQTSMRSINAEEAQFTNRSLSPHAQLSVNRFKNFEINYRTKLQRTVAHAGTFNQFQQETTLSWLSTRNTLLSFTAEQYRLQNTDYFFADIKFRFTPKGGKNDFEITAQNLFNQDHFRTVYLSEYMFQESTFRLRPRQFLIRGSFRL